MVGWFYFGLVLGWGVGWVWDGIESRIGTGMGEKRVTDSWGEKEVGRRGEIMYPHEMVSFYITVSCLVKRWDL